MIHLDKLSKVYRNLEVETTALRNIDLHVDRGDFLAVMGPSGCGKSTLLNILGLLDTPTSGNLIFNEQDISDFGERERTKLRLGQIGFIFQNFNLIDELTVFENVELPLVAAGVNFSRRKEQVLEVLNHLKIGHRGKHLPHQLSGGQQQRVAIARAMICRPELILADEPTGNLDSKNGRAVMKLLRELNREGKTIVMVTHNRQNAEYAHRIIRLLDGQIIQ
jgi:putative ABC transport system ATP-binding protein